MDYRRRQRLAILCVLAFVSFACEAKVYISLTAPGAYDGAAVKVDGVEVATLQMAENIPESVAAFSGAVAHFQVPTGTHELRIEKEGLSPIVRILDYDKGGEDYLYLTDINVGRSP